MWFRETIDVIFSLGLFVNAMLFVPQAIRIIQQRNARDLSLTTYIGFCVTQLAAVFYGYFQHDYRLMIGFTLALMTCGTVTVLMIYYRKVAD